MVRGAGPSCPQAVARVGAALATGRAAVSEGVTSIRQSPSLEEFFVVGPGEKYLMRLHLDNEKYWKNLILKVPCAQNTQGTLAKLVS